MTLEQLLIENAKQHPYYNLEGYMERDWMLPFEPDNKINCRLHKILKSDDDRALHDHPWPTMSVILEGGYWEIMPLEQDQHPAWDRQRFHRVWRKKGDIIRRAATDRHRLEVEPGTTATTMFVMGAYENAWGFYTPEGKVYWKTYLGIVDDKSSSSQQEKMLETV